VSTITASRTKDNFEAVILSDGSPMTPVSQAFATFTQNADGGGECYYKITYTYEVDGSTTDLLSYSNWLSVTGSTATISVTDANLNAID
jgi:hypothetical protein